MSDIERCGTVDKCPVCGSQVDPTAFHCPTCRSNFCFHCRARVLPPDTQLQCVNQQCAYYGKLVCGVCNEAVVKEEPPAVYAEPEDGYWPAWLALVLAFAAVWWYFTSFLVAGAIAGATFAGGGYWLQRRGINIFGREITVERPRKSAYYTCVQCGQPVKELRKA
jgi:hypothetical protein